MDLQYLQTFKTATESESFTETAEKLGYTRSTVTIHIHHLENEFGFKLFEKYGRKMILTDKARDILPYIDNILLNYQAVTRIANDPQEKVRIAVVESYLTYKFQKVIKEVRQTLPDVELEIQTIPCSRMYDVILDGRSDLAIHYDVRGRRNNIHTEDIHTYPLVLFGSTELPGEDISAIFSENSRPPDFIDLEENGYYQQCLNHVLKKKYGTQLNSIVLGSVASLIQCVKSNLGIAILPQFAIEQEIENGTVRVIKAELEATDIPIALSYHCNKWLSPDVQSIIQSIRKNH